MFQGEAYTTIEDCDIKTFCVMYFLCNRLHQIYRTYPTHEHYRSELQNILMRNNESMIDYIGRVKDLHQALIDEIGSKQELTEDKQCEIDDLTLQSFCDGLLLKYQRLIIPRLCRNLSDAYDQALELYAKMEYEKERRRDLSPPRNAKYRNNNRQSNRERRAQERYNESRFRNNRNKSTRPLLLRNVYIVKG
ncbi:uncharacterized protein LOC118450894 [Vespa mandarinia]|uniref:uncharacterized protein LOC118450894 n=1 Tax=Vespa mandarinia TaxID=7446 RepID=UPI0016088447|nr:uncharacterized protein LOC118450894 [Vespa mandarinia]